MDTKGSWTSEARQPALTPERPLGSAAVIPELGTRSVCFLRESHGVGTPTPPAGPVHCLLCAALGQFLLRTSFRAPELRRPF